MRLVANAWRENADAERARDRAIARLSAIVAEARAMRLTDPLHFPADLFARWVCATTAASSLAAVAFARWARHADWHRILQPGAGTERSRRIRALIYRRSVWDRIERKAHVQARK